MAFKSWPFKSGLVPSDLVVSCLLGRAFLEVDAFQDGVLPVFPLDCQDGLLPSALFVVLFGMTVEEAQLQGRRRILRDDVVWHHVQSPHKKTPTSQIVKKRRNRMCDSN